MKNEKSPQDIRDFATKKYEGLLKEKNIKRDSGPRHEKLCDLFISNSLYQELCNKLTEKELLSIIKKYLWVPSPFNLDQEGFDCLVETAIKDDDREGMWRLASNYSESKLNFILIMDYYIKQKDDYYLTELISIAPEKIPLSLAKEKLLKTQDNKFINNFCNRASKIKIFSEEEIAELKASLN